MLMSPVGRPKSENAKDIKMNIRISKETANDLQECATKLNTSKVSVIERGIDLVKKQIDGK